MSMFTPGAKGPLGLQPRKYDVEATNRTAATGVVGEVSVFDFTATEGEVNIGSAGETAPGATDSIYSNVRTPAASDTDLADGVRVFAVGLETPADNANGMYRVCGEVQAMVAASQTLSLMTPLAVDTSGNLEVAVAGDRIVACSLSADNTTGAALRPVIFDGESGAFAGFAV